MKIQQRLTQLERVTAPIKDTREPLLIEFLGYGDEPDPDRLAGILYIYDGVPASEYRLKPEQLAEYKTSGRYGDTEVWQNTVPRPPVKPVPNGLRGLNCEH